MTGKPLVRSIPMLAFVLGLWGCAVGPKPMTKASTPHDRQAAARPDAKSSGQPAAERPHRKQFKGTTDFPVSAGATKDPTFLTPLPKGYETVTEHLPEGLALRLPLEGAFRISNGYGFESRSWTHQTVGNTESANDFCALDIGVPVGAPVYATARGRVLTAQDRSDQDSYGKYIVIDHGNGIHSIYAHLSKLAFEVDHGKPEIWVEQGQRIGESGNSGGQRFAHLHFAIHKDSYISESGCDVGGKAVVPEPLGGYYGIRSRQILSSAP